ncbi:diacylglycerol/lipid kinase family protein [Rhodococcus sp. (in: high G+C Gram-positive bacteria)]|uniref:diacylglycerol/lipid kinase family protein n=1 Tax=Rhodococcus sp. TaxID=1831 RepID=UPI00388CEE24
MTAPVDESHNGFALWWARLAWILLAAALVVPIVVAGLRGAVLFTVTSIAAVVVAVAAVYGFLTWRGLLRLAALVSALCAPIVVLVVIVRERELWVIPLEAALVIAAFGSARAALRIRSSESTMPEYPAETVHRPFLVMNPHSGGGKVVRFDLRRRAEELGAEVVVLEGPEFVDVQELARRAVARGADLLGVAGGDGTQALVAGVAAEHGIPFLVISAGTRNHFALDLGLDREDPVAGLEALRDGVELHVDLGNIDGRPFVNNASFGVYAEIVESPQYREDKAKTVLDLLPDLLDTSAHAGLRARIDGTVLDGPRALLVSNNPYTTDDLVGMGRRLRLDRGRLGVIALSMHGVGRIVGVLRRARTRGLVQRTAAEVVVFSDEHDIAVGVDGESVRMPSPVRCTVVPGALRVLVPRDRPGMRIPRPVLDWVQLSRLARATTRR